MVTGSLSSLVAAFKLPDLRRRILFVFGMFGVFVIGLHIPIPGVSRSAMDRLFEAGGNLLGLFDVFSGGALRKFSIFAMGIIPYINASIIFQLLGIASPRIQELAREGESGRRKISQYTRYLTIALAMMQAWMLTLYLRRSAVLETSVLGLIPITFSLTAGTAFLMWLGEQITDKGIGNGVSLIIFAGIMARVPFDVAKTWDALRGGAVQWHNVGFMVLLFVLTVLAIVYMQQGQRKIPIQHAKRVVGMRMYSGASTFLPLRVNSAGVIPIIFAISVSMFPATIAQFLPGGSDRWENARDFIRDFFTPGYPFGSVIYFLLVIFFTYFYTAVTFNVEEVADNLKKSGGYVPGIRPGKPTRDYLDRVLVRLTLAGALFLAVIALMQYYVGPITGVTTYSLVGGTSLLIVVGVALETMQQIEAHLVMRHYEGFIR